MLKRTPAYPLLIGGSLGVFGPSLPILAAIQHGLGLMTAALTYWLGRQLAGRAIGLASGLAAALAGNLLIFERLVMTETLFTTLLVASITLLVSAARSTARGLGPPALIWLFGAGLVIAAATLTRPVAQALLVLAPVAILLAGAGWRRMAVGTAVVFLGYALLLAPWTLQGSASEAGSVGALGQTLIGRTARHDRHDPIANTGFVFYDPARHDGEPDQVRLAARQILQEAANRGSSGRAVHTRLRRELGLSEVAADRLMRDLAVEAISQRPGYYLDGTLRRFWRLWTSPPERIARSYDDQGTIKRNWEDEDSRPLLEQVPGASQTGLVAAEALTRLQPGAIGLLYPALFVFGVAAALADRRYRLALVPGLAVVLLVGVSVALVGGVERYRYPEDPLIFAIIGVGAAWVAGLVYRRGSGDAGLPAQPSAS